MTGLMPIVNSKIVTCESNIAKLDERGEICERQTVNVNQVTFTLADGVDLALVEIQGGSFTMGSVPVEHGHRANEGPRHNVEIAPFLISQFTITQTQWHSIMGSLPLIDETFRGGDLPVVNTSWPDVEGFCKRLSEMTDYSVRLPSEAEWEYACRAGTNTPFHWGATISDQVANFNAEQSYGNVPAGKFRRGLTPVGSFGFANAFGLYDMHGNVWEWCADAWHDDYRGATCDGRPWIGFGDDGYRVQRGGSWRDRPELCRSAFRVGDIAFNHDHVVGLRVSANLNPNQMI